MGKKTLILPIILAVCLMATACGTQSEPKQEEKTAVVKMKYPVSVDDAKQKVAKKNEQVKVVAEKATVTPTVTPEPTMEPTPEPTPEPVEEPMPNAEPVVEEPVLIEKPEDQVVLESTESAENTIGCSDYTEDVQYGTEREDCYDVPPQEEIYDSYAESEPVYESYDAGMQYVGDLYVTFYSADLMGSYGSANGLGSIPWQTCAAGYDIPFGTLIYVGDPINQTFEVRDRGVGSGQLDIFCNSVAEMPGWGAAYIPCYIVAWGDGRTAWGYE